MNEGWWVFLVCFSPSFGDRGDLGNGFGFFPLSRSVVAVCMCAIEMRVVCFTTDFTDTGPYLLLLVSRRLTSSSSSLGRGGVCSWCVCVL